MHDRLRRVVPLLILLALAGLGTVAAANPPWIAPLTDGASVAIPPLDPAVPAPADVLGYPLGDRFTRHDRLVAYFERLAATSPRVRVWQYGETYEGRPLILAAIGRPEVVARLEEIAADRQQLANPRLLSPAERQRLLARTPAILWLAYGVHGNEASSAEAAMGAAYVLAAGGEPVASQLDDLLVIVDPLVNPDGRERYVGFYQSRRGGEADPRRNAAEHDEPWPGGRGNHYFVDLNRDWAWATQVETRQRLREIRRWEPQVYVDYHEMSPDSTYFFPPPAEPVHPAIDADSRALLEAFGRANAAAFDREGWPYFVRESYDLFYPAYGDTYPTLRGGVGMTYEMAGGGAAGSLLERRDGSRLSLADRLARHLTTSLATVATASTMAPRLLSHFVAQRAAGPAPRRTFLWSASQPEADALADLLRLHGIEVSRLAAGATLPVASLAAPETAAGRPFPVGTYLVDTDQPLGRLAATLLEREAAMAETFVATQRRRVEDNLDGQFYDVTAWSLPLAFGVEAWVHEGPVAGATGAVPSSPSPTAGRLGLLVPPQGLASYRLAAALLRQEIPFRLATRPLRIAGRELASGTLFVPRGSASESVTKLASELSLTTVGIDASYTEEGLSLGSSEMVPVGRSRIGLVRGEHLDPTSFGHLWHLFDRTVDADHTVLEASSLDGPALADLDVLILPDGRYGSLLGEEATHRLLSWVRDGGILVALGGAADWAAEVELVPLRRRERPPAESGDPEASGGDEGPRPFPTELFTPGAIVGTELTPTPLAAGLSGAPPVLFWGGSFYEPAGDPQTDVLVVRSADPVIAGFAWPAAREALPGSLLVWTEEVGRGRVVAFAQDPAFRSFWRATMPLLLNAALYGPSL